MSLAQQAIADLPPAAHILVAATLGVGLVMWLFGQRLLRPMFGALGAVTGSLMGFFLAPALLPPSVFDVPSPYLGAAVAGILGLVVGVLIFRFAVGIGMALVSGLAALLITGTLINTQLLHQAAVVGASLPPHEALMAAANRNSFTANDLPQATRPVGTRVREFLGERVDQLAESWKQTPHQEQVRLTVASVVGTMVGLLLGLLMPRRSAAACTALLGAAIWLPALGWILHALEVPGRRFLDMGTMVWLMIWGGIAFLGFALQIAGHRRGKPAEA
jgi:ElaB/YqjD/DUF883 family membrane-anchored ribosome-binding protein